MNERDESSSHPTIIVGKGVGKRPPADLDQIVTAVQTEIVGRLVIVGGPGQGGSAPIFRGSNSIGRGADSNVVVLDFGDTAIHRETHAFLTVDRDGCRIGDNGKPNPVRVNGRVVNGFVTVTPADSIEIGNTRIQLELL